MFGFFSGETDLSQTVIHRNIKKQVKQHPVSFSQYLIKNGLSPRFDLAMFSRFLTELTTTYTHITFSEKELFVFTERLIKEDTYIEISKKIGLTAGRTSQIDYHVIRKLRRIYFRNKGRVESMTNCPVGINFFFDYLEYKYTGRESVYLGMEDIAK